MSRAEKEQKKTEEIQKVVSSGSREDVQVDQIAKIRGWFRPAEDSSFYPIVQDYLNKKLTLDDATKKLCDPIDENIRAAGPDDVNFMDLWYSILHAARRTHYRDAKIHESIISLVAKLKTHTISDNEKYDHLYGSLKDLDMACRESYNDAPIPGSSFKIESEAWANLNYFHALLFSKQLANNSIFAIWAMRQALETPNEDDEDSTAAQKLETYVPAAAVWALGASRALYEKEEDLTPKDKKHGNPARGGVLWEGKAEFSHARYDFWAKRFAEIAKMEELSSETRDIATDAVEAMSNAKTS